MCEELKNDKAYIIIKRRKKESTRQEFFFIWISAL
jgi:hypothetical protein